jgi:hypothetical protein
MWKRSLILSASALTLGPSTTYAWQPPPNPPQYQISAPDGESVVGGMEPLTAWGTAIPDREALVKVRKYPSLVLVQTGSTGVEDVGTETGPWSFMRKLVPPPETDNRLAPPQGGWAAGSHLFQLFDQDPDTHDQGDLLKSKQFSFLGSQDP